MRSPPFVAALVVAAGRGLRAGGGVPKQYRLLAGRPLLSHAVEVFQRHDGVGAVLVVIGDGDRDLYRKAISESAGMLSPVTGGAERQSSVLAGLEALAQSALDIVLVHDAARPFLSPALIDAAIAAVADGAVAAVPGTPVVDTIKAVDAAGRVVATPDRANLRAVQTPQAFAFRALLDAHRRAATTGVAGLTDDASVMEWAGHAVAVFPGEAGNVKLTLPEDFDAAERRMRMAMNDTRVGQGYDVHAFTDGDHVWLGGVRIPHDRGVLAHSDGDVVLHAATDAILGALADGDIGTHFPPNDPQWRGASSDRFLAHAAELLAARGGRLAMLDVTVVCEAPRVGPYREAMRDRMAAILAVGTDRIAIKATTSEKMGFTGRREGLAALAVATVRMPGE
jgi:2-C-methyl-D-erythritol 4-phosphate cytidylyltransferase/2-C-methyl-D-erythritol 2,4-cyclodiphosphate synthase